MINNFLRKYYFSISMMVIFLLTCQTPISASKLDASKYGAGFNATDATVALQGAINSGADTVIVPNMGTDWIVKPIFCKSNQTIIFEKGVVVTAQKGYPSWGYLFSIGNVSNVSLIGYGATFRMQKADYLAGEGGDNQWRHCIGISTGTNIKILGLILRDSGGDGVAVMYNSNNVLIKDVICDNNYRNGISPIWVTNLTIENCVMLNTWGYAHGPWAGVDFEPNKANNWANGQMINCYLANNSGSGVTLSLKSLDDTSTPVDIKLRHCFISGSQKPERRGAITFDATKDGVRGAVSIEDCIIENTITGTFGGAIFCSGKGVNSYAVNFSDCQLQNSNPVISFSAYGASGKPEWPWAIGGLNFVNCTMNEPDNQKTITHDFTHGTFTVAKITGNMTFNGPYGPQVDLGTTGANVTLNIATNSPTKPPIVTSVIPDKGSPAHVTDFTAGDVINISAVSYDPDIATANGSGISKVDFALWRGDGVVASISDASAPYEWDLATTAQYKRGIYLIRITAYSQDGSYTVAVVPVNIFEPTLITGRVDLKSESNKKLNVKTFPNPLIERVTFEYSLPDTGETDLKIYDISGVEVKIYDFGLQSKGLNNKNVDLRGLADGIYFYRLTSGKAVQNGKIIKT
ncbi:MAG: T9SS type A sorting domain-containing protein [Prolixibacteraceae bacterium]|jgi:hypothetical protein|nr:T9SS type A sorting domain-containing protein [Prolixibacteraceae bacterium]